MDETDGGINIVFLLNFNLWLETNSMHVHAYI